MNEDGTFLPRPVPPRRRPGSWRPRSTRQTGGWPVWLPWTLTAVLALAVATSLLTRDDPADTIAYSALVDRATAGGVRSMVIDNRSGRMRGRFVDGTSFRTSAPWPLPSEELTLLRSRATFEVTPAPGGLPMWLTPVLALGAVALVASSMRQRGRDRERAGTGPGSGRSRPWWSTERPQATFRDVAGHAAAKDEVAEVVRFLQDPATFRDIGAKAPRGLLLVGPPGTGKTLMARALAGEAGVPFLSVSGSDFMELYVGVGASRVRELFASARRVAPCIVFIDEIDAVGRQRGSSAGADERDQTLNQLLSEMDGFDTADEVIVLAATNRVDVLDEALLRPGRFDRQVLVPLPEIGERLAILRAHLADRRVAHGISVEDLARATPGMSGADLANLVNEAALHAIRRGAVAVHAEDLDAARDRVVLGIARDAVVLGPDERRAIASHEAGHAVVATLLPNADPVDRVTILPRGRALGATLHRESRSTSAMRRDEVLDRICVALAGRAAESVLLDTVTTGVQDDLLRATRLARHMVVDWGMSERFGPRAVGDDGGRPGPLSEAMRARVDQEIDEILRAEERRAVDLLRANRTGLDRTVERLLVAETLDGDTVRALVASPGTPVMTR